MVVLLFLLLLALLIQSRGTQGDLAIEAKTAFTEIKKDMAHEVCHVFRNNMFSEIIHQD